MLIQPVARYGAGYHAWEIRKPEYYNWLKVSSSLSLPRIVRTRDEKLTYCSGFMQAL